MAKKPTDLTYKWWDDNRPKTLKKTGFGQALKDWAAAKKTFEAGEPSQDAFVALLEVGTELGKVREKAEKACTPKLHDDTKEALVAYRGLIQKDMQGYNVELNKYALAMTALRKDLAKHGEALKKALTTLNALVKNQDGLAKLAAELEKAPDAAKKKAGANLVDGYTKQGEGLVKVARDLGKSMPGQLKGSGVSGSDYAKFTELQTVTNTITAVEVAYGGFDKTQKTLEKAFA